MREMARFLRGTNRIRRGLVAQLELRQARSHAALYTKILSPAVSLASMAIARRVAMRFVDCGAGERSIGPERRGAAVQHCLRKSFGRQDFVQARGVLFGFAPFFRFSVCDDAADERESRKCE